ncbi:hypothetical protein K438DRAFT_2019149 [Mycena galopus ATCC 62051]|nr:hypothetical protein K438DRAFT_2019149 [Mycena galopus ATCC 62051]
MPAGEEDYLLKLCPSQILWNHSHFVGRDARATANSNVDTGTEKDSPSHTNPSIPDFEGAHLEIRTPVIAKF